MSIMIMILVSVLIMSLVFISILDKMSINQRAKDMGVSDLVKRIEKLEEENKKLSEENGQLKEKIQTLELRLDNKEKLNEEYRKQLDGYKM